ncbi:MAG: metal-dependent transcriptional regulator [Clostridia bacterium]|jgi:Mn-dependent DtxR family transcriptional regulator|nr:metal-dependent transcriptional regulator [Clostridia bacterium]
MHLQESGQMYLETILILSKKIGRVRSIDVVEYMGFSKPSVSRAVRTLKSGGYITIDDDGYLHLTDDGRSLAENIYERHNILTELLVCLGVDSVIASEDACKIEHCISPESFEALKNQLANIKK